MLSSFASKSLRGVRLARRFAALNRSQWWPTEKLEKHQLELLLRLLQSAQQNTEFYKAFFREYRFNPSAMLSISDLRQLPVINKKRLLSAPLEERLLRGVCPEQLVRRDTSGSTAEPFCVFLSRYEKDARVLMELRMLRAHGLGPRDKMLSFRRTQDFEGNSNPATYLGLFPHYYESFMNTPAAKLDALRHVDPHVVKAHPSTLAPMAQLIAAGQIPRPKTLRRIVSCAEYLDASTRKRIEEAFEVPVIDQYGTVEFGFLAWECPSHEGFHVNAENFIIEIVDEDGIPLGPDQIGEIVVTSLSQLTMPLIRYRTGDRARWVAEPCSCGRGLPRFHLVMGRTLDRLFRADGSEVNPQLFTIIWEGIPGIVQFQVIQEALDSIIYRYVSEPGSDHLPIEAALRGRIHEEFGESTKIKFEGVTEIPLHTSGKLKYVHSKIATTMAKSARQSDSG